MRVLRVVLPVVLVIGVCLTIVVCGIIGALAQNDVAAEVAAVTLTSAQGRAELAATVVDDLQAESTLASAVPGLDQLVQGVLETPILEKPVAALTEQGVRTRLDDPRFEAAAIGVILATVASALVVRVQAGRARTNILVGLGGMLGSAALAGLPRLAELHSALSGSVASALVDMRFVAVVAIGATLVLVRALLAELGMVPYRSKTSYEQDYVDYGF